MVSLMPVLLDRVIGHRKRQREDAEFAASAQKFSEAPWDDHQQVGMLDDEGGTDEVRDGQRDSPVDALLGKLLVDHLVAGAGSGENHVILALEPFPVKSFADAGMIGAGQHDVMLTEKRLLIEACL